MKKETLGSILLFIAAMIWGSSFIVMKSTVDFLSTNVLLFIRFFLGTIILSIVFFHKIKQIRLKEIKMGFICGLILYSAYIVQTLGLTMTTPSKNAFLTAVYCAIVPFLVWIVSSKKPDNYNFIAALLSVIGIGLVSLEGDLTIGLGDLLTLCGGVLWAIHILVNKNFASKMDPVCFTILQFMTTAIVSLIGAILFEDISIITKIQSDIFFQLGYLSIFATAITMLFQTIGQVYTSECRASLILSLESVFGVLFSVFLYGEILSIRMIIGFILIFIAIIISETKLEFLKRGH